MTTSEERKRIASAVDHLTGESTRLHLALLTVQLSYGVYYVLTKSAMSGGVNQFVFAVYREVIALCFIVPLAYYTEKELRRPLTFQTSLLIFVLGFVGIFLQQTLFLAGLSLTNTTFAAALQNAIPVFTFMIAVVCRIETIRFRKMDGIAKLVGMLAAVTGALIMCLYKGKMLFGQERSDDAGLHSPFPRSNAFGAGYFTSFLLGLGIDTWQIGALCLVANCFCMAVYTNLQIPVLRRFPAPVSLSAFSIFIGSLALVATGVASVTRASEWILSSRASILSVVYAGVFASGLNFSLLTWANQHGGPVLVAAYIPLQAVFSGFLGVVILEDPLYAGSVIGAMLILMGLYLVIWGQNLQKVATERESFVKPFSGVMDISVKEPLLVGISR
ncbi:hypothetical protein R1flu_023292 [Riccia fluitans]|uniref:WAT1-related protein n=1 Tax=Riccia fluitans TaxID=41844 RepID=A0ABD1XRL7_9MARC